MAVAFVIGRAGAGKTRYCLERAAAHLTTNSPERIILLVPEQASFQMERALTQRTPCGGFWRADVLSFTRLARRIATELGVIAEPLRKDARRFALRHVVARCESQLDALRSYCRKPGFLTELGELFEEWFYERITVEELQAAAAKLPESPRAQRIRNLIWLFEAYGHWLRDHAPDPAQRLDMLCEQLPRIDWLRDAHVFVDGFAGFTGQEFDTLAKLAQLTRSLTITLLIDPRDPVLDNPSRAPDPLGLFARTAETYGRLIRTFHQAGVEIRPPIVLERPMCDAPQVAAFLRRESALAALWDRPFRPVRGAAERVEGVRIVACETPRDELRRIAAEIRRCVILSDGKVRHRDCAVIARDLEPLADLCREVFTDYDIPFFLDRRRTLRTHPLVALAGRIFDAVRDDFDSETMLNLLRTDLLALRRDESEALQRAIAEQQISGMAAWNERWPGLDRGRAPQAESQGAAGSSVSGDAVFERLQRRIAAAFAPLFLAAQSKTAVNGGEWARCLYGVLHSLGAEQRLADWIAEAQRDNEPEKAEIHRLAWVALTGALDELHTILQDTPLSLDEAAALLNHTLSDATVGLTPPRLDQVLVSAIDRSRHPEIRHAWLIGFNEGMFPRQPPQPLLLTNSDRLELERAGIAGIRVPQRDAFSERLLAYIAMTRASESLTISYSRLGLNGDAIQPSPFLAEICEAFGISAIEANPPETKPTCLIELARALLEYPEPSARLTALAKRVAENAYAAAQLQYMLRGREYRNRAETIPALPGRAAEDEVPRLSVTDIETYLQCPFRYFAQRALRINPQRGPRPLEIELGEAAHGILAHVTQHAMETQRPVSNLTDGEWLNFLSVAIEEYRASADERPRSRRPQREFLHDLLYRRLRELVVAHADRWRRGSFSPIGVEVSLADLKRVISGDGATAPPAAVPFRVRLRDGKSVEIDGRIDRLDRAVIDGRVWGVIYDYKSKARDLKQVRLTPPPALQLFLYASAAQLHELGVAGVLIAPLTPDDNLLNNKYFAEADPVAQRMLLFRPRGVVDEEAWKAFDSNLRANAVSPVIGVRLNKDGVPYSNSDAIPARSILARCGAATESVVLAGAGILAGNIDIAPLSDAQVLACRMCEFRPLCRFERGLNPIRAAEKVLPAVKDEEEEAENDESDA